MDPRAPAAGAALPAADPCLGEVVTKNEILDALWPDRDISEASLTKCVARLRSALADDDHTIVRTAQWLRIPIRGAGDGYRRPRARATVLPPKVELAAGDKVPHRPGWVLVRKLGAGRLRRRLAGRAGRNAGSSASSNSPSRTRASSHCAREGRASNGLLREGLGPRDDLNRILDWNFAESPYFIETSYWPEGNLAEWCTAQGGAGTVPLDTRDRDRRRDRPTRCPRRNSMGVLHKDLKPANVLIRVTASGRPAIRAQRFRQRARARFSRFAALGITGFDAPTGPRDHERNRALQRARAARGRRADGAGRSLCAGRPAVSVRHGRFPAGRSRRGGKSLSATSCCNPISPPPPPAIRQRRLGDAAEFARRLRHPRSTPRRGQARGCRTGGTHAGAHRARSRAGPARADHGADRRTRRRLCPRAAGCICAPSGARRAPKPPPRRSAPSPGSSPTIFCHPPIRFLAGDPDIKVKDVLGNRIGQARLEFSERRARPHTHKRDSQFWRTVIQTSNSGGLDGSVRFDGFRVVGDRSIAAEQGARRGAVWTTVGFLNGIFWRLRTGAPWADIPERVWAVYGPA